MSNQDVWILQARLKELGDAIVTLEGMATHYGEALRGGVEGAYYKDEALTEAVTILNRRKLELLAELNYAEKLFNGWLEEEASK